MNAIPYSFVNHLWDSDHAAKLDPVAKLIYRSNLLGSDVRITNTGGGNTSAKFEETDPFTGRPTIVLWVKGSGGDLRTAKRELFSSLYQDKLIALQDRYAAAGEKGYKSATENAMVHKYFLATFNLNPRSPSIDTPLHSFVPYKHIDHTHPNAVIAIAASKNAKELTQKIYGEEVLYLPWQRPGFDLGLKLQALCKEHPKVKGVVLGQHGLISWANEDEECYLLTLTLIEKAAQYLAEHDKGAETFGGAKYQALPPAERHATLAQLLPWLRGCVSQQRRFIGTWQDDEATLTFVNSINASRLSELGTSCPDHFLRTKIKPLYIDWNPKSENFDVLKKKFEDGLEAYRKDYAAYYEKCKHADSPALRDSNPTVILVPGLGLIAWGKDKSESRIIAEFYGCAIEVIRGAEAVDAYIALPAQEAFDIEYWKLEEAKLARMPAEKELAQQIIAVVGAGSGIGREVALRLVREGAHVVAVDLNPTSVEDTVKEIISQHGLGAGAAGSGISGCGPAIAVSADVTKRESIRAALQQAVLAYGGIDSIAVTAGIFVTPDADGNIPDEKWALTFGINVTGLYLMADEARPLWKAQDLSGSLVLTTSANAVVVKKGSVAYDTSKAAVNHLIRELAVELAPLVRVNGVSPATVIQGSAMFPRERVIAALTKYKIVHSDEEPSNALTAKLAQFYADRTLTKNPITTADQAEAIFLLLTNRLSKTTGQILSVDGGLQEAFLR
jgi:rhamnulose-1-phosphate aldolase/alcohol dehydrogenase